MLHRIFTPKYLFIFIGLFQVVCFPAGLVAGEVDFLNDDFYEFDIDDPGVQDPLESFNRVIFQFNDTTYIWVLEPVASLYSHVVPYDLRGCVYNFFRNLEEPVRFVNSILQGRVADAGEVLKRFVLNSTLGVYGLGDVATRVFDVPPVEATLGGTLAHWGVGDGFYLVVPLYGSSTLRDFTGTVVDSFGMTPYYAWTDDIYIMGSVYVGKETNKLSLHLGEYEELKKVLFDPYISFRNAYFQYRTKLRDRHEQKMDTDKE